MQKQRLYFSVVVFLGVVSFVSCFIAEFKKSKKEDVRWDRDRNCSVPATGAFGLGVVAVLCIGLAQIVGNVVVYRNHRTRRETEDAYKASDLTLPTVLLILSWVSFVVVVLLLSTATSMSRTQAYGHGWLEQECYLVKDGVFTASGCLVLLALGALIVAAIKIMEKKLVEQVREPQDTITKTQDQEPREQHGQIQPKKSETVISIVEEENSNTDISRI